jgi:hypothetical protein
MASTLIEASVLLLSASRRYWFAEKIDLLRAQSRLFL